MVESRGATLIRPATAADAEAVVEIWTEAYVTRGVGGRSQPYEVADFAASSRDGDLLVAEGGLGIEGAVVLFPPGTPGRDVARPDEAELSRLAVALPARRRGIGRALAELCGRQARQAGWGAIALWSRPAQVEAHRLYESLGYARCPERDTIDATGGARVVFRLAL